MAHAAAPEGGPPRDGEAWGWRKRMVGVGLATREEWEPEGKRVGWLDGDTCYVIPAVAYGMAEQVAHGEGEVLGVGRRALTRRLRDRRLLVSAGDDSDHLTVKRVLSGVRQRVLALPADRLRAYLRPATPGQAGHPDDPLA